MRNRPNIEFSHLILAALLALNFGCGANKSNLPDPIPELPYYPNARQISFTRGSDSNQGFSKTVRAELLTSDSYLKVGKFYSEVTKENGWKGDVTMQPEPDKQVWKHIFSLSKGTSVAKIEIEERDDGGASIIIERKDK